MANEFMLSLIGFLDEAQTTKNVQDSLKRIQQNAQAKQKQLQPKLKIFDTQQLQSSGTAYIQGTANIVDKIKAQFSHLGKVNVNTFADASGKIKSLSVAITENGNIVEKFKMQLAGLNTVGNLGFVQVGKNLIDKTVGTDLVAQTKRLSDFERKLVQIKNTALNSNSSKFIVNNADIRKQYNDLNSVLGQYRKSVGQLTTEELNSFTLRINKLKDYIALKRDEQSVSNRNNANASTATVNQGVLREEAKLETLKLKWKDNSALTQDFHNKVKALQATLANIKTPKDLAQFRTSLTLLREEARQLDMQFKGGLSTDQFNAKLDLLNKRIQLYMQNNSRASKAYASQFQQLQNGINTATSKADLTALQTQFQQLQTQIKIAGYEGQAFGQRMVSAGKKFLQWTGITSSIMYVVQALRQLRTNVKELDSSMVSLKKVTNETDTGYNDFFQRAIDKAKELNTSVKAIVDSTAEFSKLGYGMADAELLSEVANVYANVGEFNIDDASTSLVSTIAGFKELSASDAWKIVDTFNHISNNFSISAMGIGEALKRSASALSEGNNSMEESIAMITTANTVVQDYEKVGTALRTLSLRIRGSKAELEKDGLDTEGMVESTSRLRDMVLAIANVDILKESGTEFKSTYQILNELSQVWKNIDNEVERSALLEALGGKMQSNVLSSLLNNGELLRDVYYETGKATNSARVEQEKWSNSIEASEGKVKATFEAISTNILKSDVYKGTLDTLANILDVVDKLTDGSGGIPAMAGMLGGAFTMLGGGFNFSSLAGSAFTGLWGELEKLAGGTATATKNTLGLVGSFTEAEKMINAYNASANRTVYINDSISRINGGLNTSVTTYLNSLHGANANMEGYINTVGLYSRGLDGLKNAFKSYNNLASVSTTEQLRFADVLSTTNMQLGNYLTKLNGAKAGIFGYLGYIVKTKVATTALTVATKAVNLAFNSLLAVGVGMAITKFVEFIHTQERLAEAMKESTERIRGSLSDMDSYKQKIDDICESTVNEEDKIKSLIEVKNEISEKYRREIDDIKDVTEARKELNSVLDAEAQKERQTYLAQNQKQYEKVYEQMFDFKGKGNKFAGWEYFNKLMSDDEYGTTTSTFESMYEKLSERVRGMFEAHEYTDFYGFHHNYLYLDVENEIEYFEKLKEIQAELQNMSNFGELNPTDALLLEEITKQYKMLDEYLYDDKTKRMDTILAYAKTQAEELYYAYSKLNGSLSSMSTAGQKENWTSGLIKLADDDMFVIEQLQNMIDNVPSVASSDAVDELALISAELSKVESGIKSVNQALSKADELFEDLVKVMDENADTDKFFSSHDIIEMLDKYPELHDAILVTAQGYKIEEKALENLRDAKLKEKKTALQTDLDTTRSLLSVTQKKLSMYQSEIKGVRNVIEAKKALATLETNIAKIQQLSNANVASGLGMAFKRVASNSVTNSVLEKQKAQLEQYIKLNEDISTYTQSINKLQTQIDVLGTNFDNVKDDADDMTDAINRQKKAIDDLNDDLSDAQENINDLIKLTMDMIKKEKELEKEALEERLDNYEELIDKKKELLDIEKEQYDFQKELNENNDNVLELQQQIASLSVEGAEYSLEDLKLKAELEEKLAEEKAERDDFLYEHEIDSRKDALDREQEAFETQIEAQIKIIEDYLDYEGRIRQDAIDLINGKTQEFYNNLSQYVADYTTMSSYEFNKLWNDAYEALMKYSNGQIDVSYTLAYLAQQIAVCETQIKALEKQANATKNALADMTSTPLENARKLNSEFSDLVDKASQVSALGGIRPKTNYSSWSAQDVETTPQSRLLASLNLPKFHDGGIVSGTSTPQTEVLAKLLQGEIVATPAQAENFMSKTLPELSGITTTNNSDNSVVFELGGINITGNADANTVSQLRQIQNKIATDVFDKLNQRLNKTNLRVGF